MEKLITLEIPEQWLQGLSVDEGYLLQDIIQLGIYQFKVQRALELYRMGTGSLGYAAEKLGLGKGDLIREARARGMEPAFNEETVQEELAS